MSRLPGPVDTPARSTGPPVPPVREGDATIRGSGLGPKAEHHLPELGLDPRPTPTVARRRSAAEHLPVEAGVGDAQCLPFPDRSFDAVLSTYGAMFARDAGATARELVRVCRPGGRIALANWSPGGVIDEMFAVLHRHRPGSPDLTRSVAAGGTAGKVCALFPAARVDAAARHFDLRCTSCRAWSETFLRSFGPAAPDPADTSGTATVLRAGLLRAFGNHTSPDGPGVRIRHAYLEAVITPLP
ncbi:class I SAM-dependent methyltransferase [Streptomyces cavourensis]|uniref:class I SAM-dependent methyltransferase n=1 Tax=Streptomyces cavourensis TaxID=67258 RepID=UPI0023DD5D4D|nr:class I SAM-dependent methyltransferase [Streptomyces cavourensis]